MSPLYICQVRKSNSKGGETLRSTIPKSVLRIGLFSDNSIYNLCSILFQKWSDSFEPDMHRP